MVGLYCLDILVLTLYVTGVDLSFGFRLLLCCLFDACVWYVYFAYAGC